MNMGGASKSLVTLASELQEKGHHVIVIVPIIKGQVYSALKGKNIKTIPVFFGWRVISEDWNPVIRIGFKMLYPFENVFVAYFNRVIRKNNIDIVHSNSSVIDIGVKAAVRTGIPHVWHFREFQDFYHFHFIPSAEKRMKLVRESNGKVIFISHSLFDYYRDEIPDEKCTVIYNGISEDFLCPKEYKKSTSKVVFLISGNLHRNKGQDTALKAVKILKDKGFDNFELWIAGRASAMGDSKKFEQELREFADHNLKDCCRFLGFVSDMKELRQKTDVELVCSSREAFGRVTVEAMMSGNPVIGTNTGANPELIEDQKNGRLFQNGNAQDLAEKMQWYLENPKYIEKCGREAYSFSNRFLSSVNTDNIDRLYRELVQ